MADYAQIAQGPQVLPIPGVSVNPNIPSFRPLRMGDVFPGIGDFVANGSACRVPALSDFPKLDIFFHACPPGKFLNIANPECSCAALRSVIEDHAVFTVKLGAQYFPIYGGGTLYPLFLLLIVATVAVVASVPFVYYISYRMSRRELMESKRGREFFLTWHQQRLSSLICLALICFGFVLLLLGITGPTEINVFGFFKMSTSLPGLGSMLLGFLTWRMIINKSPAPSPLTPSQ
jgi:hypothetical protein